MYNKTMTTGVNMINVNSDTRVGMIKKGNKNKERVRKWFLSNPGETIADCSRALGLNWQTVKKHVVSIKNES